MSRQQYHCNECYRPSFKDRTLHNACAKGNLAVVEFLIGVGWDIEENSSYSLNRDEDGTIERPLYLACEHGHISVVQFLVEKGAQMNYASYCDKIALRIQLLSQLRTAT